MLNYIRIWDKAAADRPDHLIANSKYTQERIRKYYGRDSEIIYPPVTINNQETRNNNQTNSNNQNSNSKHFLIVSRLSPYKKIDMVVEAFNKLSLPLVVIGEGQQEKYLRKIASGNVEILGWKSDEDVEKYYQNARAFVFAGVDDFGMAPVEAMAHGIPVLAIRKGGILEIVEEGKTGEFFDASTPEVIADGVRRFVENEANYNGREMKSRAEKFNGSCFKDAFFKYIDKI